MNAERAEPLAARLVFCAELGVHEADVAWQSALHDGDVASALAGMLDLLRAGEGLPFSGLETVAPGVTLETGGGTKPEALILARVLTCWQDQFARARRATDAELESAIEELLRSLEVWSRGPTSRGYLAHIAGSLRRDGITVDLVDGDGASVAAAGTAPDDLELEELVGRWLEQADDADIYEALVMRVAEQAALGQTEPPIAVLGRALDGAATVPGRAVLLWLLGWLQQEAGQIEQAILTLLAAVEADPEHVPAWRTLGLAYVDRGDAAGAGVALERVLQLEPTDERTYDALLALYAQADDLASETDLLDRWVRAVPRRFYARYMLARALLRSGHIWRVYRVRAGLWLFRPGWDAPFVDWAAWARFRIERRGAGRVLRRVRKLAIVDGEGPWWAAWLEAVALYTLGDRDAARERLLDVDDQALDRDPIAEQAQRIWQDAIDPTLPFWSVLGIGRA